MQWGGITVVVVVRDIMHDDKRMEGIERGEEKEKSGWQRMKGERSIRRTMADAGVPYLAPPQTVDMGET